MYCPLNPVEIRINYFKQNHACDIKEHTGAFGKNYFKKFKNNLAKETGHPHITAGTMFIKRNIMRVGFVFYNLCIVNS